MEIAVQIISNDKSVRSNSLQDLKDFNSQSLATQAKRGEQPLSMMPATEKPLDLMADDLIDSSTKNFF